MLMMLFFVPHLRSSFKNFWTVSPSHAKFLVLPSARRKPSLCRNLHSHTLLKLTTHHQVMSNKFSYLGSTMHSNVSQEDEIFIRLGKASTTDRVWKNTHLTTKTKVRYEACNSSILLFGAECWTTYRYLRCLRSPWNHMGG